MKASVGILIVLLVCLGGWKVWDHWSRVREQQELGIREQEGAEIKPDQLPGLPFQLEARLSEAKQRGPQTLKQFIDTWRHSPEVKDPRLAWIELDYVTMIASSDPVQAKRLFFEVKQRISTNSVIYPRIRALSKAYE
jgi:hypothetical protein